MNTLIGASGVAIGGIVGFADASTTTERYNNVVGCVNEGAIDAQATRTAGVVATMNKYTNLENCANNAAVTCSDVTASNSRVAGIVSAMGGHTYLTSCVNIGTVAFAVAGDTTHGYAAGIAGQTNYSASKAGLIGLTKSLAKELASRNVTVNAVAPGFIATDMTAALPEAVRTEMCKTIPEGRAGQPEDVANAVAFFAAEQSSYLTGQVLCVDGGMAM